MNKYGNPIQKDQNTPPPKNGPSLPLLDFFKQAKTALIQKSQTALTKIHHKMVEEQTVFVLPLQNRKKLSQKEQSTAKEDKSPSKPYKIDLSKPHSTLTRQSTEKLGELLRRKHELMMRLRKIDNQLHNPSLLPVTIQSNGSLHQSEVQVGVNFKGGNSRLNLNFKQSNTYNLVQHQKNMEMLTRLNNEKLKRQEKIVTTMKRKQELELRKLEELEKNKSKVQLERQSRVMRVINKKETEKLRDTGSADSTGKHYHSFQKEKEDIRNEFDDLEDIQIGTNPRLPTQSINQATIEKDL